MRRLWRENSLALAFLVLFLAALAGQAYAGWHEFNSDATTHGEHSISLGRYLVSSAFGNAVMENWQSEYLQFTLYILLTVWFVQRGSPESKELGKEGTESDREQLVGEHATARSPRWARVRGVRLWIYSNSLLLVMATIWLGAWFAQSVTGWSDYNADQLVHGEHASSYRQFLGTARFWESTLQNWQSEFLAVGSMAVLSIYLRQRGSPESKPVGSSHTATGTEG
jgi:membrane protein implicated in regulation of membrane protease activity